MWSSREAELNRTWLLLSSMWGDTREDYNYKHKWHKYRRRYRAGPSSLWGIREGSLEDIWTTSRYNLELTKKRTKDFQREEIAQATVWRWGMAEWKTCMVHSWCWTKPWGRIVGNEAGEIRAKTRFEKVCVLILPLPQNKLGTLRRSLPVPEPVSSILRRKKD